MNTMKTLKTPLAQTEEKALVKKILKRYQHALENRGHWETLWGECYEYVLPQRSGFRRTFLQGQSRQSRIFDSTALESVDKLAASLLGHLTPPFSQWFGLKAGPALSAQEAAQLTPVLEKIGQTIQTHFERSNFSVEIHQCYLDLVVGGTASLYCAESDPGSFSAFRFSSVPLTQAVLEEGDSGFLDGTFRQMKMTARQIQARYADVVLPVALTKRADRDPEEQFKILEAIVPDGLVSAYYACLMEGEGAEPVLLAQGRFEQSPMISFRWLKSPDEVYGRSPVMTALPDIKTANKVVELILKNASIAVTGIWQADDDGVLNPANIELVPGSIIPKAVGSAGLQPLGMPGRFDISELVLESLQTRIRQALLSDKLGPAGGGRMTATEIIERSADMALLLGATYGRLQTELLTPLIKRAFAILRRRGEVPDIALDGRYVTIDYRSPLARHQGQRNVQNTLSWITSVLAMGPEAASAVNLPEAARFLGEALGVPHTLIRKEEGII